MGNDIKIADTLEWILSKVLAEADAVDPTPTNYFLLRDEGISNYWFLGFLFKTREHLRTAIENGVCYQIHQYVLTTVSSINELQEINSYILFDFGKPPESNDDYKNILSSAAQHLKILKQEHNTKKFDTCGLCGHEVDSHLILGNVEEGESAPKEGWMTCANKECTCFRTWSLG